MSNNCFNSDHKTLTGNYKKLKLKHKIPANLEFAPLHPQCVAVRKKGKYYSFVFLEVTFTWSVMYNPHGHLNVFKCITDNAKIVHLFSFPEKNSADPWLFTLQ